MNPMRFARCHYSLALVVLVVNLYVVAPSAAQQFEMSSLNAQISRLSEAGKLSEAIPLAQRVVEISKSTFGQNHTRIVPALNNLAALYTRLGRFADAELVYMRALSIRETSLNPDIDIAQSLQNLADVYIAQGRIAEAEPLYKRARAIQERVAAIRNQAWVTPKISGRAPRPNQPYLAPGVATQRPAIGGKPTSAPTSGVKQDTDVEVTPPVLIPSAVGMFDPIPVTQMKPQLLAWFNIAKLKRLRFREDGNFSYLDLMGKILQVTRQASDLEKQNRPADALAKLKEIETIRPLDDIPILDLVAVYTNLYGRVGDIQKHSDAQGLYLGILQAIAHSGNGSTADTAVQVLSTSEAGAWLYGKKLTPVAQHLALTSTAKYIVVTAEDAARISHDYFFDVTAMFALENPRKIGEQNEPIFGLHFPDAIGGAQRASIRDYDKMSPGSGYGAKYMMTNWNIDVYIYDKRMPSISDDPMSDIIKVQLSQAKGEIAEGVRRGVYDKLWPIEDYFLNDRNRRVRFVCSSMAYFDKTIFEDVTGYVCLTGWNNKFVKLRATTPKRESSNLEFQHFAEAWFDVLWPNP
jgi:tetratricopeptide (TPR) repeat protein